jgi:hypothetical protein
VGELTPVRRRLGALALCLVLASAAAGGATKAAQAPATARVFISPSGEPFRPGAAVPSPFEAWFRGVDVNHDGRIDRAEFRADALAFFKRLDANGDGVIDGFEITAYETTIAPELAGLAEEVASGGSSRRDVATLLDEPEPVSGADLDLTSKITEAEWVVATDRRFDLLDKKRQGYLEHDALAALVAKGRK